jgi:hypothetical protein
MSPSNPLITGPRRGVKGSRRSEARGPHGRPQALATDLESLGKTRDMDVELVLPGDGEPIFEHRGLIDGRVAVYGRRANKARLIA